jgi:hypothetical protein
MHYITAVYSSGVAWRTHAAMAPPLIGAAIRASRRPVGRRGSGLRQVVPRLVVRFVATGVCRASHAGNTLATTGLAADEGHCSGRSHQRDVGRGAFMRPRVNKGLYCFLACGPFSCRSQHASYGSNDGHNS